MIYIWLIFGLIGIILIFISGKETLKNKFKNFNYTFAACSILGGFITFIVGLMALYIDCNEIPNYKN
jgi:hypothetical protein